MGKVSAMDVIDSRDETVGRIRVRRALPRAGRRTIGAWCFADHMGPVGVTEEHGLDIGPHPHTGLQTVTWLVAGQVLHRDSLGSEQLIAPGQLNLMTAGRGVTHAEEATGAYRGPLHGIQLWIAQPEATRHGAAAFEHHAALPSAELGAATATVLVGELGGARSPARYDTPLVGAELVLRGDAVVPLEPGFEHGLIVLDGAVEVTGPGRTVLTPSHLGYLGSGRAELALRPVTGGGGGEAGPTRVMLLGGEPLGEQLLMWWNFVARTRTEVDEAYASCVGSQSVSSRYCGPPPRQGGPSVRTERGTRRQKGASKPATSRAMRHTPSTLRISKR